MLVLDKEKAKGVLVSELGYKPYQADSFLDDFPAIHDELEESVKAWLEDRSILDVEVEDLLISSVMETQSCNFLFAIKYLNRLLDEDISPETRDLLKESLQKRPIIW